MRLTLDAARCLPADGCTGTLVGRAWLPGEGPAVVALREDGTFDISAAAPTMAALINAEAPVALVREALAAAPRLGAVAELIANSAVDGRDETRPHLLAPCDLQPVKACGVTFVRSMLERVIEEQARGNPDEAQAIRATLAAEVGADLASVRPGSAEAERLKAALIGRGLWSQYLEVGIGPDAEVFSKCPPMAAVGLGETIGLHPRSVWNNPEPEVVLAIGAHGRAVGATLGNDVNLRDFEGRSALLLGRAKDNNASTAIGPLLRLYDETFTPDHVRRIEVSLTVAGEDGFVLEGTSAMAEISRDIDELVAATIGPTHQYPDGVMLFTGTMFAPTEDRDRPGQGFTHKAGDLVTISAPALGALVNRVGFSDRLPPWSYGIGALMASLGARGLI